MENERGEFLIYRAKDGEAKLEVNLREETVWLDAHRIAKLFGVDRTSVVRHIKNIYSGGELNENSTCAKITADGRTGDEFVVIFP